MMEASLERKLSKNSEVLGGSRAASHGGLMLLRTIPGAFIHQRSLRQRPAHSVLHHSSLADSLIWTTWGSEMASVAAQKMWKQCTAVQQWPPRFSVSYLESKIGAHSSSGIVIHQSSDHGIISCRPDLSQWCICGMI